MAAIAIIRNPADVQAANNLGVSLSEAADYRSSALVLLYVTNLRPDSPLGAVNLGWTYFNGGAAAAAEQQLKRALVLAPDMPGANAGLGLLAVCHGDNATAQRLLKASIKNRFSAVVAGALIRMQAAEKTDRPAQGKSGQGQPGSGQSEGDGQRTGAAGGEDKLPDLPVTSDPGRTAGAKAPLAHVRTIAGDRLGELNQRYRELAQRVASLNRRATQSPDGALYLPRVFDRELFEFRQAVELTFASRIHSTSPVYASPGQTITSSGKATSAALTTHAAEMLRLQERQIDLGAALLEHSINHTMMRV